MAADNLVLDLNGHDGLVTNEPVVVDCNYRFPTSLSDGAYTSGEGAGILLENMHKRLRHQQRASQPSVGLGNPLPCRRDVHP